MKWRLRWILGASCVNPCIEFLPSNNPSSRPRAWKSPREVQKFSHDVTRKVLRHMISVGINSNSISKTTPLKDRIVKSTVNKHLFAKKTISQKMNEPKCITCLKSRDYKKPQEETGLINLAYTETGISARSNHTHYGTFCTCTCLATELASTPTVNQSSTGLSEYLARCKPSTGALKWYVCELQLIRCSMLEKTPLGVSSHQVFLLPAMNDVCVAAGG